MALSDPCRKLVTVANPAAGANFSIAVPKGEQWHVVALHFKLATSAAVANRSAAIQVLGPDGATPITEVGPGAVVQAASLTNVYNFQAGANGTGSQGNVVNATTGSVIGSLPGDLWLTGGCVLQSAVAAIDVADQISSVSAWVEFY